MLGVGAALSRHPVEALHVALWPLVMLSDVWALLSRHLLLHPRQYFEGQLRSPRCPGVGYCA
jgi:hypothetical protein